MAVAQLGSSERDKRDENQHGPFHFVKKAGKARKSADLLYRFSNQLLTPISKSGSEWIFKA
jgi:hypothetical protein